MTVKNGGYLHIGVGLAHTINNEYGFSNNQRRKNNELKLNTNMFGT